LYTAKELRRVLTDNGLEVFRVKDDEVHLAERQNLHLMEAGIRIHCGDRYAVTVVARSQQSDAPTRQPDAQFALVREGLSALFTAGFTEQSAESRTLHSVSDSSQVVDVWYEVTVRREFDDLDTMLASVKLAIGLERYLGSAQDSR
jgi:hypothetical protein